MASHLFASLAYDFSQPTEHTFKLWPLPHFFASEHSFASIHFVMFVYWEMLLHLHETLHALFPAETTKTTKSINGDSKFLRPTSKQICSGRFGSWWWNGRDKGQLENFTDSNAKTDFPKENTSEGILKVNLRPCRDVEKGNQNESTYLEFPLSLHRLK